MTFARNIARVFVVAGLLLGLAGPVHADNRASKLRVAFLYNFLKYTTWPDSAFEGNKETLKLCVIGDPEFNEKLNILANRSAQSKQIIIRNIRADAPSQRCQLTYIDDTEERVREINSALQDSSVLTVSEWRGVTDIAIFQKVDTMQFEVDLVSSEAKGLTFSSQLLKVAAKVLRN